MSDDLRRQFGQNLASWRNRAELSQEELSVRASLHRTEVGQLERGLRLPQLDTILKLAGSLEISAGDLLKGMAWRPGSYEPGEFCLQS